MQIDVSINMVYNLRTDNFSMVGLNTTVIYLHVHINTRDNSNFTDGSVC